MFLLRPFSIFYPRLRLRLSDFRSPASGCKMTCMKNFFLVFLFPSLLTAQNMELTRHLGETVLCGDIALSPDGANVAWVQSIAATQTNRTFIRTTYGGAVAALRVNLGTSGERT